MEFSDLNLDIITYILSFATILPKYIHLHSSLGNAYRYHLPEIIRFMRRRYFGWNAKKNRYLVHFNLQRMAYLDDWESILYLLNHHKYNCSCVTTSLRLMNLYNKHDLAIHLFQIEKELFGSERSMIFNVFDLGEYHTWLISKARNNIEPPKIDDYLRHEWMTEVYNKIIAGTYQFISEAELRRETEKLICLYNKDTINKIRYIYQKYNIEVGIDDRHIIIWTCKDLWSSQLKNYKCIKKNIAIKSAI